MLFLRKYNVTLDASTAGSLKIRIPIRKAGSADFATGSDWTPASGDVKVSKDGGTAANIGTLPSYSQGRWEFILSGTELSAKVIDVTIVDSATKAIDDEAFNVETFGHASAMFAGDYVDSVRGGMTALPNAAAGANGGIPLSVDASGRVDVLKINGTSQTARDIGASVIAASVSAGGIAASSFASGAIDATAFAQAAADKVWSTTARVLTAGTNIQLPANGLANVTAWTVNITGSLSGSVGSVTGNVGGNVVGSVGSLSGVTFPTNFGVLSISASTGLVRATDSSGAALATSAQATAIAGYLDTEIAAIKAKTDLIPTDPAETSDIPSASDIASAVSGIDVDGLNLSEVLEILLAVLANEATPVGDTVIFRKRDGTTAKLTITYGTAAGERTGSAING